MPSEVPVLPLPYGWIQRIDNATGQPYYTDTKATPPRSIWVHPYEDEQFLREHPDVEEMIIRNDDTLFDPPPYEPPRRHSYSGQTPKEDSRRVTSIGGTPAKTHKKGFFSKLKDKAIGTKAEREEMKRKWAMMQAQQAQQRRMAYGPSGMGGYYGNRGQFGYGRSGGMGMMGPTRGSRFGGGGMAMPLMGGMAGGLILGDMLSGGFGDGGGFGGGGFDGGFGGGGGFGF